MPPEVLLKALPPRCLYTICSERHLIERLDTDLLFRWFCGLDPAQPVFDATAFTHNRVRYTSLNGYATGFQSLLDYIDTQIPRHERIEHGLRTDQRMYPDDTIREPLGNALIHQDFSMTGVGPLVEIFTDRIEITNPGSPLVPPERFLDAPPRSRNETLAALMQRMRICEERGSGIDKVVQAAEDSLLPAPDFLVVTNHTRVVINAPRSFAAMTKEERLRAAYQHASLQWVLNHRMKTRQDCAVKPCCESTYSQSPSSPSESHSTSEAAGTLGEP